MASEYCEAILEVVKMECDFPLVQNNGYTYENTFKSDFYPVDSPSWNCSLCDGRFESKMAQKEHLIRDHSLQHNMQYTLCNLCNAFFTNKDHLEAHRKTSHHFECAICNLDFTERSDFENHLYSSHVPGYANGSLQKECTPRIAPDVHPKRIKRKFTCVLCKKSYLTARYLQKHERHAHNVKRNGRPRVKIVESDEGFESPKRNRTALQKIDFYCPHCEVVFYSREELLNEHLMEEVHGGEGTRCAFCMKELENRELLNIHLEEVHLNPKLIITNLIEEGVGKAEARLKLGKYYCTHCELSFGNKAGYTDHVVNVVHSAQNLNCKLCAATFRNNASLRYHVMKAHAVFKSRYLTCKFCGVASGNVVQLQAHLIRHFHLEKFNCQDCSKSFLTSSSADRHRERHHSVINQSSYCSECKRSFKSEKRFRDHVENAHNLGDCECTHCDMIFGSRNTLRLHMRQVHDELKRGSNSISGQSTCTVCAVAFRSEGTMHRHMEIAHRPTVLSEDDLTRNAPKRHLCSDCGMEFTTSRNLDFHLALKHGYQTRDKMLINCEVCGARIRKNGLEYHMLKHSDERKFICEECGASFKHGPALAYHRKAAHSTTPPQFQCTLCGNQFRMKACFDKHMQLSHATFDNPQKCPLCQKEFRTQQHVRNHINTSHHRKYRHHQCPHCLKMFTKSKLPHHMVVHTGAKDFICPYCPKACGVKDNLRGHIRRCHPDRPCTI